MPVKGLGMHSYTVVSVIFQIVQSRTEESADLSSALQDQSTESVNHVETSMIDASLEQDAY